MLRNMSNLLLLLQLLNSFTGVKHHNICISPEVMNRVAAQPPQNPTARVQLTK